MGLQFNPFTNKPDITGSGGGGGSPRLAASYQLADWSSETTWYTGINSSSSSTSDANWTITKRVLSGPTRNVLTYYTATDSWDNRSTATYSTSLSYSA